MAGLDEIGIVEKWIVDTLTYDPDIATVIGGRIYETPPDEGTEYPYVIYSMSSSNDVIGVGIERIMSDTMYTVKAVSSAKQTSDLADLANAIDEALTLSQPEAVGLIGTVLSCHRERIVKINEYTSGTHFSHRGGDYKIIVQKS